MSYPNIIYIHSHDTGRYIQPYGWGMSTPNFQRLAEGGVLFRKAFCAAPTCSPSRAALLTGQSAHNSGMLGLAHRGFSLADPQQHLANFLKSHGYETMLVGVQHEGDPRLSGYARQEGLWDEDNNPTGLDIVDEYLAGTHDRPFFLSIGFFETHRIEWVCEGFSTDKHDPKDGDRDSRYVMPPPIFPDTPQTRRDFADFLTAVERYDRYVGRVLEALERNGLAETTLIISTTDHGIAFPGMKCNLTDHGIGVMLMMRGPGGFTGGKVVDGMVSHIDVYPTVCDYLGVEHPAWLQGKSFLPLVNGEVNEINEQITAEVTYHAAYEPQRCVRTKRYKYIRRYDNRQAPVLPNCDDSFSKTLWLESGWQEQPRPQEMLFDVIFDPQEVCNIAERPDMAGVLAEMRARLDTWMRETDDPLHAGPVAAPSGAKVNDSDGRSPRQPAMITP